MVTGQPSARGSTEHRDLPSRVDESRLRNVSDAVERKPLAETPGIEHRIDTSCDRARERRTPNSAPLERAQ